MSKIPGPSVGYIDILDAVLHEEEKDKEYDKIPIRPSAAGKCTRELAYAYHEYKTGVSYEKEDKSPSVVRLLSLGHYIESHLISHLRKVKRTDKIEDRHKFEVKYTQQGLSFMKINDGEFVEGQNDLCFWSPKWKCVADVKSKKDKFSAYYATKWDEDTEKLTNMTTVKNISAASFWVEDLEAFLEELNDPFFEANFVQLNLYCLNPFFKERGVDHGVILQYNKNDSRLREIRFRPNQKIYNAVIDKFKAAMLAIDEHNDPTKANRDYTLGSIKCAFCDYKKECWEGKDSLQAFFATFPKKNWPKDTNRMGSVGEKLEELYEQYVKAEKAAKNSEELGRKLAQAIIDAGQQKVRFEDGHIYETKELKTKGLVVRRTKL